MLGEEMCKIPLRMHRYLNNSKVELLLTMMKEGRKARVLRLYLRF